MLSVLYIFEYEYYIFLNMISVLICFFCDTHNFIFIDILLKFFYNLFIFFDIISIFWKSIDRIPIFDTDDVNIFRYDMDIFRYAIDIFNIFRYDIDINYIHSICYRYFQKSLIYFDVIYIFRYNIDIFKIYRCFRYFRYDTDIRYRWDRYFRYDMDIFRYAIDILNIFRYFSV